MDRERTLVWGGSSLTFSNERFGVVGFMFTWILFWRGGSSAEKVSSSYFATGVCVGNGCVLMRAG